MIPLSGRVGQDEYLQSAICFNSWLLCQPKQFDLGESGSSPATDCPATNDQTPLTQAQGQNFLGMAFANMASVEISFDCRQTRDCDQMASARLQVVLALEITAQQSWTTKNQQGNP